MHDFRRLKKNNNNTKEVIKSILLPQNGGDEKLKLL